MFKNNKFLQAVKRRFSQLCNSYNIPEHMALDSLLRVASLKAKQEWTSFTPDHYYVAFHVFLDLAARDSANTCPRYDKIIKRTPPYRFAAYQEHPGVMLILHSEEEEPRFKQRGPAHYTFYAEYMMANISRVMSMGLTPTFSEMCDWILLWLIANHNVILIGDLANDPVMLLRKRKDMFKDLQNGDHDK